MSGPIIRTRSPTFIRTGNGVILKHKDSLDGNTSIGFSGALSKHLSCDSLELGECGILKDPTNTQIPLELSGNIARPGSKLYHLSDPKMFDEPSHTK